MIDKTQPLFVWLNGVLIEDFVPGEYPVQPDYEKFHRLPVVLRNGRNTILVKSATPTFTVRIGDSPRDRIVLLAEQRRFAEAAQALSDLRVPLGDYESGIFYWRLISILATNGQHTGLL